MSSSPEQLTIRPFGLIKWQGIGALALGLPMVIVGASGSDTSWVWIGAAFLALALVSVLPAMWLDADGVRVRNFVRRYQWRWDEVSIGRSETPLFFTRGLSFSQFVVDDGRRRVRVAATTALSRRLAERVLRVLVSLGVEVDGVKESDFPQPDGRAALRELGDKAAAEWHLEQETWRRIEERLDARRRAGDQP